MSPSLNKPPEMEGNTKLRMGDKWQRIPLHPKTGDPQFLTLHDVKTVFSDDDIVVLVNRALYGMKYQREHHQKRYQNQKTQNPTQKG